MNKKWLGFLLCAALGGLSQSATAGTWFYLLGPVGEWIGPDGTAATGDPAMFGGSVPGEGPFGTLPLSGFMPTGDFGGPAVPPLGLPPGTGGVSSFRDGAGAFGTFIGIYETNGGAPDGPGVNTITSGLTHALAHNDLPSAFSPYVDLYFTGTLDLGAVNETVVAPDGRTFTTMSTAISSLGTTAVYTGSGFNMFMGETPAAVFGDPVIAAHFAAVEPLVTLAAPGWEILSTTFLTYDVFDTGTGDYLVSGTATGVSYTLDAPVPIPPAGLLLGSAIAGLAALRRRGAGSRVTD